MRVQVNGVALFVDIDGVKLAPDGPAMRERPTLVLLHGGPGLDHSMFKPAFGALAAVAQLVYVDLRGNGHSQPGAPEHWTLAQWGDDVHALCEVLEIHHPVVFGASWGGFVAQSYATRHPGHAAKLILESTAARWPADAALPGLLAEQAAIATAIGHGAWNGAAVERPSLAGDARRRGDPDVMARIVRREAVERHFWETEGGSFDFRPALHKIACPTLVLAGDHDQTLPLPMAQEMAAALPQAQMHVFHGCDHLVHVDAPARAVQVIREFLSQ